MNISLSLFFILLGDRVPVNVLGQQGHLVLREQRYAIVVFRRDTAVLSERRIASVPTRGSSSYRQHSKKTNHQATFIRSARLIDEAHRTYLNGEAPSPFQDDKASRHLPSNQDHTVSSGPNNKALSSRQNKVLSSIHVDDATAHLRHDQSSRNNDLIYTTNC